MKRYSYILVGLAVVLGILTGALSFRAKSDLRASDVQRNSEHTAAAQDILNAMLGYFEHSLEGSVEMLQHNNELIAEYQKGRRTGDWYPLSKKLFGFEWEAQADISDFIKPDGKFLKYTEGQISGINMAAALRSSSPRLELAECWGKPALFAFAPLIVNGKSVGTLVFGRSLINDIGRANHLTRTQVELELAPKNPGPEYLKVYEDDYEHKLWAKFSAPKGTLTASTGPLTAIGTGAVLLLFVLALLLYTLSQSTDVKEVEVRTVVQADLSTQKSLAELSSQVAHDIRSPLAALNVALSQLDGLNEEMRTLIRGSIFRIQDIANNLLKQCKQMSTEIKDAPAPLSTDEPTIELLPTHVEAIVTEKRMQYRSRLDIEIEALLGAESYGVFAKVNAVEFKRALSNLLDNAIEATERKGKITVRLFGTSISAKIIIQDSGKGIARENLPKIGEKGNTFGKVGGSGLGFYHAKKNIEAWGGEIKIRSELNKGTEVEITLPLENPPSWFLGKLSLGDKSHVVIVDDDTTIHKIWESRLHQDLDSKHLQIHNFSSSSEVKDWVRDNSQVLEKTFFLMDHELLGSKDNGLELIGSLKIHDKSVLITSRFEESSLRKRCHSIGVPMIPKPMAGFVPIEAS